MWALVFIITVMIDLIWVWSFTALENDDGAQAIASSIMGAGCVNLLTVLYVNNNWFMLPELVGNGVGVWLALKLRRFLSFLAFLRNKDASS